MKKIVNIRPMLFASISVAAGISFAYFILTENVLFSIIISLFFAAATAYAAIFTFKNGRKCAAFITLAVFLLLFAVGFTAFKVKTDGYRKADLGGKTYTVTGKITEICEYDSGTFAVLSDVKLNGAFKGGIKYKISVFISGQNGLEVGDIPVFTSVLHDRSLFYEGRLSAENVSNGIKYSAFVNSDDITVNGRGRNAFESVNAFIKNSLRAGLDGDEFAVAYAMLTGDSSDMQAETLYSYRSAGVAHIFAVSGLHIGFIAAALAFVFKKINLNKALSCLLTFSVCLFYSGVCGFSASSLRAVVMCAVLYTSKIGGDRYDALSSVCFSAAVLMILFPLQLFCAGFQLSFAVVTGIILLSKPLSAAFKFLPRKIDAALGAVIAAQISAIPVSLAFFGEFSLFAVLANVLFIPFSGVIFIILLLSCILGGAFDICAVTLFIPRYILKFVNIAINAIDYRAFIVGGFTLGSFSVFYYCALLMPCGIFNLRRATKTVCSLVCAATCVIGATLSNFSFYNDFKVYALGSETVSAALLSKGATNVLVISDVDYVFSVTKLKRLAEKTGKERLNSVIVLSGENEFSLQVFATRINAAFKTDEIRYYGNKRKDEETIATRSFPEIRFMNFTDGEFCAYGMTFNSLTGGRFLTVSSGYNTVAMSGNLDFCELSGLNGLRADLLIAYNRAGELFEKIQAKSFATFRADAEFDDGETEGIYFTTL